MSNKPLVKYQRYKQIKDQFSRVWR